MTLSLSSCSPLRQWNVKAGNNRSTIDKIHNRYPNDQIENGENFVDNFIVVGASYVTPLVSGIATLIRSYYPNLTAREIKNIIMKSGVSYDIMVNKPTREKRTRTSLILFPIQIWKNCKRI